MPQLFLELYCQLMLNFLFVCRPQVIIATSIMFCHRFYLRQSHAKNDRRTIATVCMFLAGKVEETPRPLKDVILVSYELIHKKDPAAGQKIKQRVMQRERRSRPWTQLGRAITSASNSNSSRIRGIVVVVAEGVGQELIAGTDDKNGEQDEYVNMLFLDVGLLL
ncbi:cyclin-T1-2-like isoform X2 [Triticum dicoccoides]|uniref:cyclin-T1-2-like isoform X2 n=1 Tax=Triticum dicoccoides TaxID=85692 RepID=UPI0018900658|nr:cyclin-T1-2-like isoform X2 [Triticum dicoccoides]